jgi:hypothetical protein
MQGLAAGLVAGIGSECPAKAQHTRRLNPTESRRERAQSCSRDVRTIRESEIQVKEQSLLLKSSIHEGKMKSDVSVATTHQACMVRV